MTPDTEPDVPDYLAAIIVIMQDADLTLAHSRKLILSMLDVMWPDLSQMPSTSIH
jgi:DNA gyrase/topoisomerase IV subunit B